MVKLTKGKFSKPKFFCAWKRRRRWIMKEFDFLTFIFSKKNCNFFVQVFARKLLWWKECRQINHPTFRFAWRSGVNFNNVLHTAFMLVGPKSAKWHGWLDFLFCAFGIYLRKSCMQNVDEIDTWFLTYFLCNFRL